MYRLPEHYHHSLTSDHLIKPGSPCSQPWKCLPGSDVLSSPKPTPSSILFSASFHTLQWAEKDEHERANVSLLLPNPHLPELLLLPKASARAAAVQRGAGTRCPSWLLH